MQIRNGAHSTISQLTTYLSFSRLHCSHSSPNHQSRWQAPCSSFSCLSIRIYSLLPLILHWRNPFNQSEWPAPRVRDPTSNCPATGTANGETRFEKYIADLSPACSRDMEASSVLLSRSSDRGLTTQRFLLATGSVSSTSLARPLELLTPRHSLWPTEWPGSLVV